MKKGEGYSSALAGSAVIIGTGIVISVPIAVMGGIYTAENPDSRFSYLIRLCMDVLQGTPSIVIGIFAWIVAVVPFGHFSAFSGSIALGIMVVPIVMKSTEETVRRIPVEIREAALALGVPYHRFVLRVLIPAGMGGIVNGILLGSTRVSGETVLFSLLPSEALFLVPWNPVQSR